MNISPNTIYMSFDWSGFLGGSAVTALIQGGWQYLNKRKEAKVDLSQNIKDIAEVHNIMERVVADTFFNRFIIFVAEDSAGILAAGKNLYVTAQYEKVAQEEGIEPIIDIIQRWKADAEYYKIFSEMLTEGKLVLKTADMPPSKLRDIYAMQGIKMSKVYHLMTTKNHSKVFYCSIASTVKDEAPIEDRVYIESAIDKLIGIFARHKKYY